jgi:hypothetical protein
MRLLKALPNSNFAPVQRFGALLNGGRTAMRLVEERSLSSILRSNLLTTLINNDVSEKPNASGGAFAWRSL